MTVTIVADTGPLIGLARVDQVELLHRICTKVHIPVAVKIELELDSGRPGARRLARAFDDGWLVVQSVTDFSLVSQLSLLLDAGEAEAIALALQESASALIIDDGRGRRAARARGIPIIGVAGILLAGKSKGQVPAVKPILER